MTEYQSAAWMREQLARHNGDERAVRVEHGIPERTWRRWMKRHRESGELYGAAPKPSVDQLVQADRRAVRLEAEITSLKARNKQLARRENIIEDIADMLAPVVEANTLDAPESLPRESIHDRKDVSLVLHLSDLHWGELVDPGVVGGANAYSPGIAARRVQHAVDVTRAWVENYQRVGGVGEIVVVVNGDTASGQHNLHPDSADEYARIATQVLDSALVIAQVARELASLVPCVRILGTQGNHTRSTRKMPTGIARTDTSWETLLHEFVAAFLMEARTVEFQVAKGYRLTTKIGPSLWSIAHGDALKGGGGQLGIPAYALKRAHDANRDLSIIAAEATGVDTGIVKHSRIGHFHTWTVWQVGAGDVAITPSPKGVDSYVTDSLAKYSPAALLLEAVHPTLDVIGQHVIGLQHIVSDDTPCRYVWGARESETRLAAQIMRDSEPV